MEVSGRHHTLAALSQGKNHDTHCKGGSIGRRIDLDVLEEGFASSRTLTPDQSVLAYFCSNCAILTPLIDACLFIIFLNIFTSHFFPDPTRFKPKTIRASLNFTKPSGVKSRRLTSKAMLPGHHLRSPGSSSG